MRLPLITLLAVASPGLAQRPAPTARVLLGQQVVDAGTGGVVAELGLAGTYPRAVTLASGTCAFDVAIVDLDAGQVLVVSPETVRLATFDHKTIWSVARAVAHIAPAAGEGQREFAGGRVVLLREGGGFVALDRATGALAWENAALPTARMVVDGDLVVTAGEVGGTSHVVAVAVANGARAFDVVVADPVRQLAAASHGIAVVGGKGFRVFDRSGPPLFAVETEVAALVAGPDGWFSAGPATVSSWSRTGAARWTSTAPGQSYEVAFLVATPDGAVLHTRFMDMADGGFGLSRFRADGALEWSRDEPGLGVPHSKYWHRVAARLVGDRLLMASQGAGGSFFAVIDPATGERSGRAQFPTR